MPLKQKTKATLESHAIHFEREQWNCDDRNEARLMQAFSELLRKYTDRPRVGRGISILMDLHRDWARTSVMYQPCFFATRSWDIIRDAILEETS